MGLDTTHDCWHGPYSSFNEWRAAVAEAAGYPPLSFMEGFTGSIPWDSPDVPRSPLTRLLNHSDCDGSILWQHASAIADALEALLPALEHNAQKSFFLFRNRWIYDNTLRFIKGLRLAASRQEDVEFH